MIKTLLAALFGLAAALSAAPSALAIEGAQLRDIPIERLAVRIDETDSEFTVVDSRMDETATAAVFFGLIGASINSATNNAEDDAKEAPLRPTAAAIDLDTIIAEAITTRLSSSGAIALASTSENASNTLVAEIGEWGLARRAQGADKSMRAFLKMNIRLVDARNRALWGPQREHSIGQMSAELTAFTPDVFRTEMETLAARAGRAVANHLIYR